MVPGFFVEPVVHCYWPGLSVVVEEPAVPAAVEVVTVENAVVVAAAAAAAAVVVVVVVAEAVDAGIAEVAVVADADRMQAVKGD